MLSKVFKTTSTTIGFFILSLWFSISFSQSAPSPFVDVGTTDDINYAKKLYQAMLDNKIEGNDRIESTIFFGGAKPHGQILELTYKNLKVDNHTGFIVAKRNYGKVGDKSVTVQKVQKNRAKYLKSITIMYQREAGYDTDNQNWFWVKYNPDGTLFNKKINNRSTYLAGRLLKSKSPNNNSGCIYCHSSAGGGDYIFYPHIKKPD
ncbi:MAG: hypothetical protein DRQ51_06930 [Gammaproteobacteria bacterium]|nr:MAG: hypothetical protein DRQ51_06930 [Gammaproteobacteria bacterium]